MSSTSIRAKIQAGLAKAISAVGSTSADLIYKIETSYSGTRTPISTETPITTAVLLTNAIIKDYSSEQVDNDNIRAGDKQLVSDHTVEITEGDFIRQGDTDYIVISVNTKAPTSDVLLYISQIREK